MEGLIAGKPAPTGDVYSLGDSVNCRSRLAGDDNCKVTTAPDAHPIPQPANPTAAVFR